jgi:hypothetical protein
MPKPTPSSSALRRACACSAADAMQPILIALAIFLAGLLAMALIIGTHPL